MGTVADEQAIEYRFYSPDEARNAFMRHLDERYPDCRASLCTPEGVALARALMDIETRQLRGETLGAEWREANDALRAHIDNWAARWRLTAVPHNVSRQDLAIPAWRRLSQAERDYWSGSSTSYSWIVAIGTLTLREYAICHRHGEPVPTEFVSAARPDQALFNTDELFYLNGPAVPINLAGYPLVPYLRSDEGWPFFTWNPHTESRADARERFHLLIDYAMDRIEQEVPSVKIPARDIDWLIRFQFDKQSHASIARTDGCGSHTTVQRAVNKVAELIGLEPRDGKVQNQNRLGKLKSPNRVPKPRKPNTKRI